MHVHELNPKKTLITLLIFALIILVGFFTMHKPLLSYKLDMKQSLSMLSNPNTCFKPWQLANVLNNNNQKVVLIDIRDKFSFGQGHIPNAENISAYDLTKKENINYLKELKNRGMTVVLYGNDQLQANGPWMWFRQIGFDNIKILLGGYNYYKANKGHLAETKGKTDFLKGIAKYNYAKVATHSAITENENNINKIKKHIVVRRKKKAAVVSGGC